MEMNEKDHFNSWIRNCIYKIHVRQAEGLSASTFSAHVLHSPLPRPSLI